MAKFLNLLKLRNFGAAGDAAMQVSLTSDTQPRLQIDAGGKHIWGAGGATTADTTLYRSNTATLKTDGTFVADGGLTVKTVEIDPTGSYLGDALVFDGTKYVPGSAGGGGSSVTVADTAPTSPSVGDLWFESDSGMTFVYYDSTWVEVGSGGPMGPQGIQGETGATGATGADGGWSTAQTLRSVTGASDTPTLADNGKLVTVDTTSGTVSITIDNSLDLPVGGRIDFAWIGAATAVSFTDTATVNATPGLKLRARYSAATLVCTATDTYLLIGDLSA